MAGSIGEPVSEVDFGLQLRPDGQLLAGSELHDELAAIRSAHRLAPVRFGELTMLLVSRFADLDACFRDDEGLPAGPTYEMTVEPCQGVTFESTDGPEHDALRDLSTRGLRRRPTEAYAASRLGGLADRVIDRFIDRSAADLVAEFTAVFPFLVLGDRLGLPEDSADRYMDWAFDILGYPVDPAAGMAAARELSEYAGPVVTDRRVEPTDDLVSSMCNAQRDGRSLDDDEVMSHIRAIFSAGATTSYHGLGNTLFALLTHPKTADRLRADASLIPRAVDEMLRWEPPLALLPRLVPADTVVAGEEVAAHTMLLFGIASANRDPGVYDDPDTFDIDRDMSRLLTFGFGSHHCPGSHLARAQIAVAVERLLNRMPVLRLVDRAAALPSGTVMRGPMALPVAW
ncbi:MAG: cytochrome P450 [Microthrixaceae bacterium]